MHNRWLCQPSPTDGAERLRQGTRVQAREVRDCLLAPAGSSHIDPGSPWQNPWVDAYGGRMRDELLAIEQFDTLLEPQVLVADRRAEYKHYRPAAAAAALDIQTGGGEVLAGAGAENFPRTMVATEA